MRVTIRDVAHAADVSVSTASRALSGARPVGAGVADRVRDAAASLGYRHNQVASALRTQRTGTIGMVVPQISNPFFPAMVEAVERCLQRSGRQLFLCDAQQDPAIEAERIQALTGRQVDGLLVVPVSATASADTLRQAAADTPVVQLDRYVEGVQLDWVGVDDAAGMRQLVEHLVDAGAKEAVLVGATGDTSTGRSRRDGFADAAARHGLATRPELLGQFTPDWGTRATECLLTAGPLPDAIVCGNDAIALGALRALRAAGHRVPGSVLLTGFDDAGFAVLADPPLTTVHQPHQDLADECVRLLDRQRTNAATAPTRVTLSPTLAIRASTTPRQHPVTHPTLQAGPA